MKVISRFFHYLFEFWREIGEIFVIFKTRDRNITFTGFICCFLVDFTSKFDFAGFDLAAIDTRVRECYGGLCWGMLGDWMWVTFISR